MSAARSCAFACMGEYAQERICRVVRTLSLFEQTGTYTDTQAQAWSAVRTQEGPAQERKDKTQQAVVDADPQPHSNCGTSMHEEKLMQSPCRATRLHMAPEWRALAQSFLEYEATWSSSNDSGQT
eukprot:6188222-Pleurochrysis_carterae.AAC.1